jgi:hypothetical protein
VRWSEKRTAVIKAPVFSATLFAAESSPSVSLDGSPSVFNSGKTKMGLMIFPFLFLSFRGAGGDVGISIFDLTQSLRLPRLVGFASNGSQ